MVLEHYISELLYRYNCVMVPELGAFLTQMKSAIIHEHTNAFYPPSKEISFNEKVITNDGLLVSYIADVEKTSYEDMLNQVIEAVTVWKTKLEKGERLTLTNIGELRLSADHKIQFQPHYQVNYLTSSFGLSSFQATPATREILKEEVIEIEEAIPLIITPEKRKTTSYRRHLKYAAILLLSFSAGFTGYRYYNQNRNQQQLVEQQVTELVSRHIQEASFFDIEPLEFPSISLSTILKVEKEEKTNVRTHHIVAGAFRVKKNADRKIRLLKRQGFEASYIGTNAFGLHQVAYHSYTDTKEALKALKNIKRLHSADAWMLSK